MAKHAAKLRVVLEPTNSEASDTMEEGRGIFNGEPTAKHEDDDGKAICCEVILSYLCRSRQWGIHYLCLREPLSQDGHKYNCTTPQLGVVICIPIHPDVKSLCGTLPIRTARLLPVWASICSYMHLCAG